MKEIINSYLCIKCGFIKDNEDRYGGLTIMQSLYRAINKSIELFGIDVFDHKDYFIRVLEDIDPIHLEEINYLSKAIDDEICSYIKNVYRNYNDSEFERDELKWYLFEEAGLNQKRITQLFECIAISEKISLGDDDKSENDEKVMNSGIFELSSIYKSSDELLLEIVEKTENGNIDDAMRMFRYVEKYYDDSEEYIRLCYYLGDYYFGKDDVASIMMFEKAASRGNAEAQFAVAFMFEQGKGIKKNINEAAKWYNTAFDNGCKEAKICCDVINDLELLFSHTDVFSIDGSTRNVREGENEGGYLPDLGDFGKIIRNKHDVSTKCLKNENQTNEIKKMIVSKLARNENIPNEHRCDSPGAPGKNKRGKSEKCPCCLYSLRGKSICDYCGFEFDSDDKNIPSLIREHINNKINGIRNIRIAIYRYGWSNGRYDLINRSTIKVCDGKQCVNKIFWLPYDFMHERDKHNEKMPIVLLYENNGKEHECKCDVKLSNVVNEQDGPWKLGIQIRNLRLNIYIGNEHTNCSATNKRLFLA